MKKSIFCRRYRFVFFRWRLRYPPTPGGCHRVSTYHIVRQIGVNPTAVISSAINGLMNYTPDPRGPADRP